MKTADAGAIGDPDTLDVLLSAGLQRVIDTDGAELSPSAIHGARARQAGQIFRFPARPRHPRHSYEPGIPTPHDRDDGVRQDGGLILRFPNGAATAFFFAFQSQTWATDDVTGKPLAQ